MELGKYLSVMATPFNRDLSVNYGVARKLARRLVDSGIEGLILAATGGESATLTLEERVELTKEIKEEIGGKVPIIVGAGTNNTQNSILVTKTVEKAGADAVMLIVPYYNKPSQEGIYRHFAAIAEATELPILLYNVPGRTGVNLAPATIERLVKIPNIVGIKDASGNLNQLTELVRHLPPDFYVYTGDDSLAVPALSIGVYGLITVAGQIAGKEIKDMLNAYWSKDTEQAAFLHRRLFPLFNVLFIVSNPVPTKTALRLMGFEVGGFRLPLTPPDKQQVEQIAKVLKDLGYIDEVAISDELYV